MSMLVVKIRCPAALNVTFLETSRTQTSTVKSEGSTTSTVIVDHAWTGTQKGHQPVNSALELTSTRSRRGGISSRTNCWNVLFIRVSLSPNSATKSLTACAADTFR